MSLCQLLLLPPSCAVLGSVVFRRHSPPLRFQEALLLNTKETEGKYRRSIDGLMCRAHVVYGLLYAECQAGKPDKFIWKYLQSTLRSRPLWLLDRVLMLLARNQTGRGGGDISISFSHTDSSNTTAFLSHRFLLVCYQAHLVPRQYAIPAGYMGPIQGAFRNIRFVFFRVIFILYKVPTRFLHFCFIFQYLLVILVFMSTSE